MSLTPNLTAKVFLSVLILFSIAYIVNIYTANDNNPELISGNNRVYLQRLLLEIHLLYERFSLHKLP